VPEWEGFPFILFGILLIGTKPGRPRGRI